MTVEPVRIARLQLGAVADDIHARLAQRDAELAPEFFCGGGWYMEMQELGYNYRLPDMLCALGISQLQRADAGLELLLTEDAAAMG